MWCILSVSLQHEFKRLKIRIRWFACRMHYIQLSPFFFYTKSTFQNFYYKSLAFFPFNEKVSLVYVLGWYKSVAHHHNVDDSYDVD